MLTATPYDKDWCKHEVTLVILYDRIMLGHHSSLAN